MESSEPIVLQVLSSGHTVAKKDTRRRHLFKCLSEFAKLLTLQNTCSSRNPLAAVEKYSKRLKLFHFSFPKELESRHLSNTELTQLGSENPDISVTVLSCWLLCSNSGCQELADDAPFMILLCADRIS